MGSGVVHSRSVSRGAGIATMTKTINPVGLIA
ncbi:hypothetical protein DES49_2789 [Halospina denitrificans]|uniref:Uncharacterized protein n=1 Tax=Halospina denitrificans TaxID=332522 RepID=A0A4R7JL49_9GAMM|nr:hypothetical protein DES49_2789 [Halospina denitrificans]